MLGNILLGNILLENRRRRPLVHCITNYVTANDCANILLACGGSAIMADDPDEVEEITRMCDGLVLNMGTPNPRRLDALVKAGLEANRLGHPVILDPVGVGGSAMRRNAAHRLLEQVRFSAVRGNATEIAALVNGMASHRGVDAETESGCAMTTICENAKKLACRSGSVVVVTGDSDIVTDGATAFRVQNGHPMMRTVTGTGCQLSAILGAYITSNPERALAAALAAVCAMGLCGEIAHDRLSPSDGNASYRNYIIDAVCHLTPETLEKRAKYEIY